jgi:hypothetical protein
MRLGGHASRGAALLCLTACFALGGAGAASASPDDVVIEGETLAHGPHAGVRWDANASGQSTMSLYNNDAATKTVTTSRPSVHVFVRVRGDNCLEAPLVSVKVGTREIYRGAVSTGAYAEPGARLWLPAGTHTVSVAMTNDHSVSVGGTKVCDRNLYVDKVTLVATPFNADGWRNKPLAPDAPIAQHSEDMVSDIETQIATNPDGNKVWTSTSEWGVPIYTVPKDQPLVTVTPTRPHADLAAMFEAVPLPDDARPSDPAVDQVPPYDGPYGDSVLVLWQPSTNTLWEFYRLHKNLTTGKWMADWGGRMTGVATNEGMFVDPFRDFGASATSISLMAGVPRLEEVVDPPGEQRTIDHAIDFMIRGAHGYDGWCWPAQRTDTQHFRIDEAAIPAGTRFRFPASIDWSRDHPGLHPFALKLAKAIQKYGMVVRDSGGLVGFATEDPLPTGYDPFWDEQGKPRANGPFKGQYPNHGGVFAGFPWDELQALDQPSADRGCQRDDRSWDPT